MLKNPFRFNPPKGTSLDTIQQGLTFVKEFYCGCGNRIRITADKDRGEGPSNFEGIHTVQTLEKYRITDQRYMGHSILPSGQLNWLGMLEERNWITTPTIVCPACKHGMTNKDYKEARRNGKLL
jgi:hypothetical protein